MSDIFFDVFWVFGLKSVICSDRYDRDCYGLLSDCPLETIKELSARISRDPCILHLVVISIDLEFLLQLIRIALIDIQAISCRE